MHANGAPDIGLILSLLLIVAVVAAAARVVRLPYPVALVLAGLALAATPGTPRVELTPEIILLVFLPVLLFESTYRLDAAELRANLRPIAILALPGVALTALLVAAALTLLGGVRAETAFLFGAIVAATDPVAVLAVFRSLGAPSRLATILEDESLFNDGTSLVIFGVVLAAIESGRLDPAAAVANFVVVSAGGSLTGAAVGVLALRVLGRIHDPLLETTITLIVAYGSYVLAEQLHVSGVLAVVLAGLVVGSEAHVSMQPTTRLTVRFVWEFLGFIANSLLFLLMGLELRLVEGKTGYLGLGWLSWPVLLAILAVFLARLIVVRASAALIRRVDRPLPRSWVAVLTWGGLRGALSLAMALSLPATLPGGAPFPDRALLLLLTFGVILFTLLAQGLTMSALLTRLGLHTADRHEDYERALGQLRAASAALRELDSLVARGVITNAAAAGLRECLLARAASARARVEALRASHRLLQTEEARIARRQLLHVERLTLAQLREAGQLSDEVWRELTTEIDAELEAIEQDDWQPSSAAGEERR